MALKRQFELVAEALRDVGILLFVFGPLDTLLPREHRTWVDWLVASILAVCGLFLIVLGIRIGSDSRGGEN